MRVFASEQRRGSARTTHGRGNRTVTSSLFCLMSVYKRRQGSDREECACQCRRPGFDPWVRKIPWGREQPPTPGEPGGLQSTGSQRVGHD